MDKVIKLIDGLEEKEKAHLESYLENAPLWLLEAFQIVTIGKGKVLIQENDPADTVFILVKGMVKATDYRTFEFAYDYTWFYPIEVFGAMEFLMELEQYKTTLITVTNCTFLKISRDQFEKWMIGDIHAVLMQTKAMGVYLLEQARKDRLFLFCQGEDRLSLLLLRLYKQGNVNGVVEISLTRNDLARSTGLSVRTINRAITKFIEHQILSKSGRKLIINEEQNRKLKEMIENKIDQL
ncbi:MAG: Crp/Fnr family transcriptional regulator [Lachnotalea sp.]